MLVSEGWAHFSEVESSAISGPQKLVKRHATVHNWFIHPNNVIGIMPWNKRKRDLTCPMARSTWIRTRAIFWVFFTSSSDKLCLPPLNGGMLRRIPSLTRRSWISNPLSAIRLFPRGTSSRRSQMPLSIKSWRSLTLPANSWLTKTKAPLGATATSPLTVVWDL